MVYKSEELRGRLSLKCLHNCGEKSFHYMVIGGGGGSESVHILLFSLCTRLEELGGKKEKKKGDRAPLERRRRKKNDGDRWKPNSNNRKTIVTIGVLTKWRFAAVFPADGIIRRRQDIFCSSGYLLLVVRYICPRRA